MNSFCSWRAGWTPQPAQQVWGMQALIPLASGSAFRKPSSSIPASWARLSRGWLRDTIGISSLPGRAGTCLSDRNGCIPARNRQQSPQPHNAANITPHAARSIPETARGLTRDLTHTRQPGIFVLNQRSVELCLEIRNQIQFKSGTESFYSFPCSCQELSKSHGRSTEYCVNNRTKILLFSNALIKEIQLFTQEAVNHL